MTASPVEPLPVHVKGVAMGAQSIRAALTESPQVHGLTPVTAQTLIKMSDDDLNTALHEAADDTFWEIFWEIYHDTHAIAIASLIATQLDANTVVPDPAGA